MGWSQLQGRDFLRFGSSPFLLRTDQAASHLSDDEFAGDNAKLAALLRQIVDENENFIVFEPDFCYNSYVFLCRSREVGNPGWRDDVLRHERNWQKILREEISYTFD